MRLGIAAPSNVPVHRREVWDRLEQGHGSPATSRGPREQLPAAGAKRKAGRRSGNRPPISSIGLRSGSKQRTQRPHRPVSVETIDGRIVVHRFDAVVSRPAIRPGGGAGNP